MSTSNDILNLGEVAAFLGWSARFVERLAVGGNLPGEQVGGEWRFRRSVLLDWLDLKIQTLDTARLAEVEHRLELDLGSGGLPAQPRGALLSSRLLLPGVELHLRAQTKAGVLRELVDVARRTEWVVDADHLHASIVEREALCSTALPGGVAIVHPRRPVPLAVRGSFLSLGRTPVAVDFGAEDGAGTRLFFLLAAVHDSLHLHTLARLSRVLREGAASELLGASTPEEVWTILARRETEIDAVVRAGEAG